MPVKKSSEKNEAAQMTKRLYPNKGNTGFPFKIQDPRTQQCVGNKFQNERKNRLKIMEKQILSDHCMLKEIKHCCLMYEH